MSIAVIISIFGGLLTVLLGINAFFIKDLVRSIQEMRVDIVRITTQHDNTVLDVRDNKNRILILEKEISRIRERLHESS